MAIDLHLIVSPARHTPNAFSYEDAYVLSPLGVDSSNVSSDVCNNREVLWDDIVASKLHEHEISFAIAGAPEKGWAYFVEQCTTGRRCRINNTTSPTVLVLHARFLFCLFSLRTLVVMIQAISVRRLHQRQILFSIPLRPAHLLITS